MVFNAHVISTAKIRNPRCGHLVWRSDLEKRLVLSNLLTCSHLLCAPHLMQWNRDPFDQIITLFLIRGRIHWSGKLACLIPISWYSSPLNRNAIQRHNGADQQTCKLDPGKEPLIVWITPLETSLILKARCRPVTAGNKQNEWLYFQCAWPDEASGLSYLTVRL